MLCQIVPRKSVFNHHEIKISYTWQTNLGKNKDIFTRSKLRDGYCLKNFILLKKPSGA